MKCYNNAIPVSLLNRLDRELQILPWFFVENTAYGSQSQNDENAKFSWQHVTMIDGKQNSYISPFIELLIMATLDNCDISYSEILRIRFGMTTWVPTKVAHEAHIDRDEPHKVGLIYLNDSDGDTILYNEKYDDSSKVSSLEYYTNVLNKQLTIEKSVNPVKNKMICFDGYQYHSSSCPIKTNNRIVLNFNFI
jgi:hypothetical protein